MPARFTHSKSSAPRERALKEEVWRLKCRVSAMEREQRESKAKLVELAENERLMAEDAARQRAIVKSLCGQSVDDLLRCASPSPLPWEGEEDLGLDEPHGFADCSSSGLGVPGDGECEYAEAFDRDVVAGTPLCCTPFYARPEACREELETAFRALRLVVSELAADLSMCGGGPVSALSSELCVKGCGAASDLRGVLETVWAQRQADVALTGH